jgi:hypothetical protein
MTYTVLLRRKTKLKKYGICSRRKAEKGSNIDRPQRYDNKCVKIGVKGRDKKAYFRLKEGFSCQIKNENNTK